MLIGLAIRLFICSQERYLTFGGIIVNLKYFNVLERIFLLIHDKRWNAACLAILVEKPSVKDYS